MRELAKIELKLSRVRVRMNESVCVYWYHRVGEQFSSRSTINRNTNIGDKRAKNVGPTPTRFFHFRLSIRYLLIFIFARIIAINNRAAGCMSYSTFLLHKIYR